MTYTTKEEVKSRVNFDGSEFFDINPDSNFNDLLDTLLVESKAIIDGQIGGETLSEETGREDTLLCPDLTIIELVWPVNSVSKVELFRMSSWSTLDNSRYEYTSHVLRLRPVIQRQYGNWLHYQHVNPLRAYSNRITWSDLGTRVRVTYNRGFSSSDMPEGVKETQISVINRMLLFLRQDQNINAMNPDEVMNVLNNRKILTEDIKQRMIGKLSQPQNKYVVL